MPKRRDADGAFSLFAFMDIITSLIGIMFLIVILLVLDLLTRTFEAEAAPSEAVAASARLPDLQRRAADLEEQVERQLAAIRRRENAPVADELFPPEPDDADQAAIAADLARRQALLAEAQTEDHRTAAEIRAVHEELDALTRELAEAQQRLAEHRARTDQPDPLQRLVTLPGAGVTKTIVLVECERNGLRAIVLAHGGRMQAWSGHGFPAAFRSFREWTQTLTPPLDYGFLVYVPSEAMTNSMQVVEWLRGAGFYGVGYEPLLPGLTAVYDGLMEK